MRIGIIAIAFIVACSGGSEDSPRDATTQDTGSSDTGTPADTGTTDTGSPADTGAVDTGTGAPDSGEVDMDGGTDMDSGTVDMDAGDMDGGAPSGACTNTADQMIHDSTDVSAAVQMCAGDCFGGPNCTRMCIIDNTGLTMECTECYVEVTTCTIQNCLSECAGMDSAACAQCRDDSGCTAGFLACSGFGP